MQRIYSLIFSVLLTAQSIGQNINVTLASHTTFATGVKGSNIWGYVDTLGNEYALVGTSTGTKIYNVTNPSAPFHVMSFSGPTSDWREVRTKGKYAYETTEGGGGLKIINLSSLPSTSGLSAISWTGSVATGPITTAHTLEVDGNYVYVYGGLNFNGGAMVLDVSNPTVPVYAGNFQDATQPYIHDGYVRNDTMYSAHIYGGFFSVVDFTNKSAPVQLATQNTPHIFTHNTWLSTNSKFLFTTDEVSLSTLAVYDIHDLANIQLVDQIKSNQNLGAVPHNTHIINVGGNDYAVTSWYQDGFTIVDAGRPHNLVEVGNYDTEPTYGPAINGAWGVYPFLPSGNILLSSMDYGLFVFTPTYQRACYLEGLVTDSITGLPINAAHVQILTPTIRLDSSSIGGDYAMGMVDTGTFDVVISKPGYYSKIISGVNFTPGVVDSISVQLVPFIPITISGQVVESGTGTPIPNAKVQFNSYDNELTATANASGNFTFSGYEDVYKIYSAKWAYNTKYLTGVAVDSFSAPLIIQLDKGYYDDFTFDLGWTVSNTCSTGKFVRVEPKGSKLSATVYSPNYDDSTDYNGRAYVTGNGGGITDFVNGGYTKLSSPVFDLTTYTNPYIDFTRWYRANNSTSGLPDSMKIMLSNGTTNVTLDSDKGASPTNATWFTRHLRILDSMPLSSTMQLVVIVEDKSPTGGYSEGVFDKFVISEGSAATVEETNSESRIVVYPNPGAGNYTLQNLGESDQVEILDLTGRLVDYKRSGNKIDIGDAENGIYLYRVINNEGMFVCGKIIKQ